MPIFNNLCKVGIVILCAAIITSLFNAFMSVCKALDNDYDIIIVGAGTAGSVLANRLTENCRLKVLVIEAGEAPSGFTGLLSSIPIAAPLLQYTAMNWDYKSTSQKYACRSLHEQRFILPSGKGLGGSSLINAMVYVRGNKEDYNTWENKYGAKGWNYNNLLPYFIKAEQNEKLELDSGYHGTTGPMVVSDVETLSELTDAFLKSGEEAGYTVTDINGVSQIGFMKAQATTFNGRRWSTYDAYLKPVIKRENLHVLSGSQVHKVIIGNDSQTAGVLLSDGRQINMKPGGEVILSAGAIQTPKILMHSGIGPKSHLQSLKIDVISDLPVGKNFQDHPFVGVYFSIDKPLSITESKMKSITEVVNYLLYGKGYFSVASGLNGVGFIKTKFQDLRSTVPDIQLLSIGVGSIANEAMKSLSNYKDETWQRFIPPDYDISQEGFIVAVALLNSSSRGSITLQSRHPEAKPIINPNILSSLEDIDKLAEGVEMVVNIVNSSSAFKALGIRPHLPAYEGCEALKIPSKLYYKCLVENIAVTLFHYAGTCRMGSAARSDTVVDYNLRVKGINGLRVVDASVFPENPSGNLAAPVIAVAERSSDIIQNSFAKRNFLIHEKNAFTKI